MCVLLTEMVKEGYGKGGADGRWEGKEWEDVKG